MADEVEASPTTPLRVATWNLNHWQQPLLPRDTRAGAWAHLAGAIGAQVALVQEAVPPAGLSRDRAVYAEMAGHRNWGSAVVALDEGVSIEPIRSVRTPWSRRRHVLDRSCPGSVAVVRLDVPGIQPITLVSVYGVHDGSAVASMHRVVADLLPLFDSHDGARVVLGGDLNVGITSRDPLYLERAEALLASVRALGLVEAKSHVASRPEASPGCACGAAGECAHIATIGASELDHLFVSPALVPQVTALAVDRSAVGQGLSDHAPLVLDLALAAERTPTPWEDESFAVEIGRRHGPAARRAVEALASWAEQRERALSRQAGVTAKSLTRLPVVGGATTEPELLLTLDLQTEPRASEVLLSVRASGDVVLWFGGWKLPPYDDPESREGLRQLVNAIPGVHVHRRELGRWPRFPLARLEEPEALLKLVDVLDRLAGDSRADGQNGGRDPGPAPEGGQPSVAV